MGGPSSNRSDDSGGGGTYADQLKASQRKKKIVDVLTPAPIKILKAITKSFDPKRNRKSKSGDVYGADEAKEKIDYKAPKDLRTGRDNDNNNQPNQKSIEQPKVASQMDNSEVKSDLITADKTAPTDIEMTDDELLLKRKRGRKTKTVLTSVTGDTSKATLSKKTLLGG
ncbi:hypothetical protein ACIJYB_03875 [Candidatus Pelagibacter bacterium nBUS_44]|uniref:hypothetical protein n=1 Tax=Candidatus Pelagibacter bacterium nBUS_44 TaxID=3374195 RepID=UPI003EB761D2